MPGSAMEGDTTRGRASMTSRTPRRLIRRVSSLAMLVAYRTATTPEVTSLSVPEHLVDRPKFPVMDVHRHLHGPFGGPWNTASASELARHLDAAGVERIVDLDGGTGPEVDREIARFRELDGRVAVFAGVDIRHVPASDRFGEAMAADLLRARDVGARGLKVWKTLGLEARDRRGRLVALDDERLDPLWESAATARLPVLIHVADPLAFFQPLKRSNERWGGAPAAS